MTFDDRDRNNFSLLFTNQLICRETIDMFTFSRRIIRTSRGQLTVAARRFGDEATSNKSKTSIWFRQNGAPGYIFGAFGFLTALAVAYYPGKEMVDDAKQELERLNLIASKLEKAKVSPTKLTLARPVIDRPGIETVLQEAMTCKSPEHYYVIYGAKGVGKSTLLEKVALGKEAVIRVQVQSSDRMNEITAKIMKAVTGKKESYDVAVLSEAFMKYTANSKDGVYPTIIFDVERGSEETEGVSHKGVLQDVRSIAHGIFNVCHCLIVVSEANAVFQFGGDPREQFIYVDEMTLEETKKYLKASGKDFSDEDLKKIYSKVGGNPAQLILLLTKMKTQSLDDSIAAILDAAWDDLDCFALKPILKALKMKEHAEGVRPSYFNNQEYKGINMTEPKDVGDAMKKRNAIVYRIDKGKNKVYQMQSTRHKNALETYNPAIDYNLLSVQKLKP